MRLQIKPITFTLRASIMSAMNTMENPITATRKASNHMSATSFSYINKQQSKNRQVILPWWWSDYLSVFIVFLSIFYSSPDYKSPLKFVIVNDLFIRKELSYQSFLYFFFFSNQHTFHFSGLRVLDYCVFSYLAEKFFSLRQKLYYWSPFLGCPWIAFMI
jgi:hypothetical protein